MEAEKDMKRRIKDLEKSFDDVKTDKQVWLIA